MTNVLQNGSDWLAGKLKEHAGRSVVYSRGGSSSDTLTATVAQREYDVTDLEGFTTAVELFDWTFTTADLVIASSAVTPRRGDRITETLNGETRTYEVTPASDSQPESHWLDSAGVMTVVHTKRIA